MPSSQRTVPPPRGGMSVKQHMIVNALPEESRKKRYLFSMFQLEALSNFTSPVHSPVIVRMPALQLPPLFRPLLLLCFPLPSLIATKVTDELISIPIHASASHALFTSFPVRDCSITQHIPPFPNLIDPLLPSHQLTHLPPRLRTKVFTSCLPMSR